MLKGEGENEDYVKVCLGNESKFSDQSIKRINSHETSEFKFSVKSGFEIIRIQFY